jgi:hypothetical protein
MWYVLMTDSPTNMAARDPEPGHAIVTIRIYLNYGVKLSNSLVKPAAGPMAHSGDISGDDGNALSLNLRSFIFIAYSY